MWIHNNSYSLLVNLKLLASIQGFYKIMIKCWPALRYLLLHETAGMVSRRFNFRCFAKYIRTTQTIMHRRPQARWLGLCFWVRKLRLARKLVEGFNCSWVPFIPYGLYQGWANYGPRAACGRLNIFVAFVYTMQILVFVVLIENQNLVIQNTRNM